MVSNNKIKYPNVIRQIEKEKFEQMLSFRFSCTLFLALCKASIQNLGDNVGLSFIGQFLGWLIFLLLLFTLLSMLSKSGNDPLVQKLFVKEEIPLYLLFVLQFFQVFNPQTNIVNGLSSFVSYFLSPILVYFISTRLIKDVRTLDTVLKVLYIFALVNLLFGIYTSIFGEPSLLYSRVEDDVMAFLTEDGKVRVKALTATEQTYYISVFIIIIFAYFRDKFWFQKLSFLMVIQMFFYPAKNPISYLIVVGIYVFFMSKRYHWIYLVCYYIVMFFIFGYYINITITQGIREIDSWLGHTMFASATVMGRYWRWVVDIEAIFKHPFGCGIGNATKLVLSPYAISEINPLSTESYPTIGILLPDGTKIEEPHNEYIRLAVEGSLMAPILLISMISNALSKLKSIATLPNSLFIEILSGLIFGFTFISFFNNHILGVEEKYMFWLMMGLTFNRYNILQYFCGSKLSFSK